MLLELFLFHQFFGVLNLYSTVAPLSAFKVLSDKDYDFVGSNGFSESAKFPNFAVSPNVL